MAKAVPFNTPIDPPVETPVMEEPTQDITVEETQVAVLDEGPVMLSTGAYGPAEYPLASGNIREDN